MKRGYFLGLAAKYTGEEIMAHTFAVGREEDRRDLEKYLLHRYSGERAILTKNGRSALALALMAYFDKGDKILVNGFTCYAVYEAVRAAGLTPVFVDINLDDLNFDYSALGSLCMGGAKSDPSRLATSRPSLRGSVAQSAPVVADGLEESDSRTKNNKLCGIIVQNTLGNPVDVEKIEELAKKHNLTIIEDLAHCAGVKYSDGREAGTVGAAAVLSFGKDKSIDTVSGGAAVLRDPPKNTVKAPRKRPKLSDHLRARFYPLFGATARVLTRVHLGGILMRVLVKIHFVEKSADSKLDLERKISKFEARRALPQIKSLAKGGEKPLREFYFVKNRQDILKKLMNAGYYFGGFWYEKPVSPERYYQKVHFPEQDCPNALYAAEHIINFPTTYRKKNLDRAHEIIAEYLDK